MLSLGTVESVTVAPGHVLQNQKYRRPLQRRLLVKALASLHEKKSNYSFHPLGDRILCEVETYHCR